MREAIAVLNAGSSSIKFSLFNADGGDLRLAVRGQAEALHTSPRFDSRPAWWIFREILRRMDKKETLDFETIEELWNYQLEGTGVTGAALAPLLAVPDSDQRAVIMIVLGLPVMVLFARLGLKWTGRLAAAGRPAGTASIQV